MKMSFFLQLPPYTRTLVFLILIMTVFLHIFFNNRSAEFGSSLLTTTGIFATFLGIAFGLQDFESDNIQTSIPALLNGLRTAFWASVLGVGGSLSLKYRQYFSRTHKQYEHLVQEEESSADLLAELRAIRWDISGTSETALSGLLSRVNKDLNLKVDELKLVHSNSLKSLSEQSILIVTDSLQKVIKDFDAVISSQFGRHLVFLEQTCKEIASLQEKHQTQSVFNADRLKEIIGSLEDIVRVESSNSVKWIELNNCVAKLNDSARRLNITTSLLNKSMSKRSTELAPFWRRMMQRDQTD